MFFFVPPQVLKAMAIFRGKDKVEEDSVWKAVLSHNWQRINMQSVVGKKFAGRHEAPPSRGRVVNGSHTKHDYAPHPPRPLAPPSKYFRRDACPMTEVDVVTCFRRVAAHVHGVLRNCLRVDGGMGLAKHSRIFFTSRSQHEVLS